MNRAFAGGVYPVYVAIVASGALGGTAQVNFTQGVFTLPTISVTVDENATVGAVVAAAPVLTVLTGYVATYNLSFTGVFVWHIV